MNETEAAYVESLEIKAEELRSQLVNLESTNAYLEEQLAWFRRQVFGPRSEKIVKDLDSKQLTIDGIDLSQEPQGQVSKVAGHKRTKPRTGDDRISIPDDLPVETIVIDLPEEEKVATDGTPLTKIGEETSHKLAYKPGSFFIKQIIRPKYALPRGEGIVTADLPDSLLPRCRADESLLAALAVSKFGDHLPLYRISEILERQSIRISRQLLSQWMLGVGEACTLVYEQMRAHVLQGAVLHMDETPVGLQDKGRRQVATGYMWVMASPTCIVYDFRRSREHAHAEELLKNYCGFLHSDKYGAYVKQAAKEAITWCPCWAHIRRQFFDAQSGDPPFREEALKKIGELFELERLALEKPPDERTKIRQTQEIPLIDELITLVKGRLTENKYLPKSALRKACGYFVSLIPYLKNYIDHPDARLDNNIAERAIRPLAIGRKNWLFVGSLKGGHAAAVLYSLVQTCRHLKINPQEYLEDIFRRLPGHSTLKVAELLPDQWAKARA